MCCAFKEVENQGAALLLNFVSMSLYSPFKVDYPTEKKAAKFHLSHSRLT